MWARHGRLTAARGCTDGFAARSSLSAPEGCRSSRSAAGRWRDFGSHFLFCRRLHRYGGGGGGVWFYRSTGLPTEPEALGATSQPAQRRRGCSQSTPFSRTLGGGDGRAESWVEEATRRGRGRSTWGVAATTALSAALTSVRALQVGLLHCPRGGCVGDEMRHDRRLPGLLADRSPVAAPLAPRCPSRRASCGRGWGSSRRTAREQTGWIIGASFIHRPTSLRG